MSNRRHIEIGKRVKEVRQVAQLNQSEFAKVLNMTQSNLSLIELGKAGIGADTVEALAQVFQVNANWLFLGEGIYHRPRKGHSGEDAIETFGFPLDIKPNNVNLIGKNVNLIGEKGIQTWYEAVSNAGEGVPSDLMGEGQPVNVPGMPTGAVVIKVAGNSMQPTVLDQDYVVCVKIESREGIRWNEIHLIITSQSMIYVKRLQFSGSEVLLVSDNGNYPTITIKQDDIQQIYHCVGRISSLSGVESTAHLETRLKGMEESFQALLERLFNEKPPFK